MDTVKISNWFACANELSKWHFWEIGVRLWSTAHFVYNSGRSRGGAWEARAPLLFLDQTEAAPKAPKKFFWRPPPPPPITSGSGWPGAPLPLSEGLDLPLYNNIATTHLCLWSLCLPCSPCRGKIWRYFEPQNLGLALCFFSGWNRIQIIWQLSARMAFRCLILIAFFCCLSFSTRFFCVDVLCSCVWCAVPDPLI